MENQFNMRHFVLTSEGNNPFPRIINWSMVFDVRKLTREKYRELPPFIMLNIEISQDGILPDMIISPFLLLSKAAMEVVNLYDPTIPYQIFALFGLTGQAGKIYYCPILLKQNDISEKGLPLFQVKNKGRTETILCLDLAESLLERGAIGFGLKVWNENISK